MSKFPATTEPRPVLGFIDVLLFFIITGVNPMWLSRAAEAGPAGVTLWILGGITFFLPLAACVLELSSRYPEEGGLYLWTRKTFGGFAAFLVGWTYWVSVVAFLPSVLYFIAGSSIFLGGSSWQHLARSPAYFVAVSLLCLAVATALNIVGLGVGKWLHNIGALGTWLPAAAMIAVGAAVWLRFGSSTEMPAESFVPRGSARELMLWPVLVMSLMGLEAASIMGGEIKDARRFIPLALALAAVILLGTKIIGTLAVLVVVPAQELSGAIGFMQAFERGANRIGLYGVLAPMSVLIVVGQLGKVGAWSAAGARLPFVAGVDRFVPPLFGKLHPRWGTPFVALLVQSGLVAALVLLGQAGTNTKGAYDVFLSMTLIPAFLPFLFLFAALIKVQSDPPADIMRVPGGKWLAIPLAILGLLTTMSALALSVAAPEEEENKPLYIAKVVGLAVVLIGVGAGIYALGARRKSAMKDEYD